MEAQTGMVAGAAIDVPQRCVRRRAFAAIGIVLLTFAAFWPTTSSLMTNWEDTEVERTYTHGYVVLLLAFWLIWRDRASPGPRGALQPLLPGAAVLAVGAVCWLVAYRAGLQIVHQAALPALAATRGAHGVRLAGAARARVSARLAVSGDPGLGRRFCRCSTGSR